MIAPTKLTVVIGSALAMMAAAASSQAPKDSNPLAPDQAVRARLAEIKGAAEGLDPDKVFSFVLENNQGALIQNGKLLLTREAALDSTREGFQRIKKVNYQFNQEHISLLSSNIALAVAEGASSIVLDDGRSFTAPFAQSVLLILTNGEWKVFHSHRSFPPAR